MAPAAEAAQDATVASLKQKAMLDDGNASSAVRCLAGSPKRLEQPTAAAARLLPGAAHREAQGITLHAILPGAPVLHRHFASGMSDASKARVCRSELSLSITLCSSSKCTLCSCNMSDMCPAPRL